MKIDFICRDGSPLGVSMKTLMGDDPAQIGVGGAECALLTLCDAWHKRGDDVVLYNDPRPDWWSPFEQRPISDFNPDEDRDVLIVFRTPNALAHDAKGYKVWLSCDQFTSVPFKGYEKHVNKVVCISPHHVEYFKRMYGIEAIHIDLPLRVDDFPADIEKKHNQFVFTSVPSRGLDQLFKLWPTIKSQYADTKLVVTSDYRLWGAHLTRGTSEYVAKSLALSGVRYASAMKRMKYAEIVSQSEIMVYPGIYAELMCLAVGEAQVAGIYTITSNVGALATTNMVKVIPGNPNDADVKSQYIEETLKYLSASNEERKEVSDIIRKRAIERFSPDNILKIWDKEVFK